MEANTAGEQHPLCPKQVSRTTQNDAVCNSLPEGKQPLMECLHGCDRERRCHCLMVVCCCNWCSHARKDQARPAYAAMGELFSQVSINGYVRGLMDYACSPACLVSR
jgi:hypothetical protein